MIQASKEVQEARMKFMEELFSYDTASSMHRSLTNVCLQLTIGYLHNNEKQGIIPIEEDIQDIERLFILVDWIADVAKAEENECYLLRKNA